MAIDSTIAILNELLAMEQQCIAVRLVESTMFVSSLSVRDNQLLRELSDKSTDHSRRLVDAILALGGSPGPRTVDASSADLHFQELHCVLPRLMADQQLLINCYRAAAASISDEVQAIDVIQAILQDHERGLEQLKKTTDEHTANSA